MSRKREAQREKRHELARQLGVGHAEIDEHRHLAERARVSRPVLRVLKHQPTRGFLARLVSSPEQLVLAWYLVDSKGARLLDAAALESGERRLDKLTYHRPAHFVLVAMSARDGAALAASIPGAALTVDELAVADSALASAEWEVPRAVRIGGLAAARSGVAVSVRGVGRVATRLTLTLERSTATVEVEV